MDATADTPIAVEPAAKAPRKVVAKRRAKPGERVVRDIKALQKSTKPILPRAPVQRLVAELLQEVNTEMRASAAAVDTLREVADAMLTKNFSVANKLARDVGRRNTVTPTDFATAAKIVTDCSLFVESAGGAAAT